MAFTFGRSDYVGFLMSAANSGTLLTTKHNPDNLATPWNRRRTVTIKPPAELTAYIASGNYDMRVYENHNANHPPYYLELIPSDPSVVTGSGILPYSTTPTYACDRFVAVSGWQQGWHIYAELSAVIQHQAASGTLTLVGDFPQ